MDDTIHCGIINSFGVTTRSLKSGRAIEWIRSDEFNKMADAVSLKWPRAAAIFRAIAKSEEQQAKREDDERELRW